MSELTARSWAFLAAAAVLDALTVRGLAPVGAIALVALVLAVGLRVKWFLPAFVAGWVLLSVPVLVALGAPGPIRNRVAVLFLGLMAAALGRLIVEVRSTEENQVTPEGERRGDRPRQEGDRWAW